MSFETSKPTQRGSRASVSVLSRGRTATQLTIPFDQFIADRLGIAPGDRVECIIGTGSNAGFYGLVVSPVGKKIRACGNRFMARASCTGNGTSPHPAQPFDIARMDAENKMVILRPNRGRIAEPKR